MQRHPQSIMSFKYLYKLRIVFSNKYVPAEKLGIKQHEFYVGPGWLELVVLVDQHSHYVLKQNGAGVGRPPALLILMPWTSNPASLAGPSMQKNILCAGDQLDFSAGITLLFQVIINSSF